MERKIALVQSEVDCWFVALEPAVYYRLWKTKVMEMEDTAYGNLLAFLGTLPRRRTVTDEEMLENHFERTAG